MSSALAGEYLRVIEAQDAYILRLRQAMYSGKSDVRYRAVQEIKDMNLASRVTEAKMAAGLPIAHGIGRVRETTGDVTCALTARSD